MQCECGARMFAVTGRCSSRHIAHVLSSSRFEDGVLRCDRLQCKAHTRGSGGGRNTSEFTFVPFAVCLVLSSSVCVCLFFFRPFFGVFSFDNLFVFIFFFVIFPVFRCGSIYGAFIQARQTEFLGIKVLLYSN